MATAIYHDDPTIQNEDDLWRRIHPSQVVPDENRWVVRPSSAAFEDSSNGTPMSVVLAEGQNPVRVLEKHEGFWLAAITAGLARECNQGIFRNPLVDESAHALVFGKKTRAVKKKLAQGSRWVITPNASHQEG
jgi:hypothetical protein